MAIQFTFHFLYNKHIMQSTPQKAHIQDDSPSWEWYQKVAQSLPGMSANNSSRPKSPVYDDIRLLGALLGEQVAKEYLWQGAGKDAFPGKEQFLLIEELRRSAKKSRLQNRMPDLAAISSIVDPDKGNPNGKTESLPAHLTKLLKAVDAFRIFLELASLAESFHQTKGLNLKTQFTEWLTEIKSDDTSIKELGYILEKVNIRLVSTAHPTQIFRLTYLEHHQKILEGLNSFYHASNENEEKEAIDIISAEVCRLWLTSFVRWEQPTVYDEAKALRHFLDTQKESLADIQFTLAEAIQDVYQINAPPVFKQPLISIGSWVSGDMDGNPNTQPDTFAQVLSDRRWDILRDYHTRLNELAPYYSLSALKGINISESLQASIDTDLKQFHQLENKRFKYSSGIEKYQGREPIRQKLLLMAAKMSNTLNQSLSLSSLTQNDFENPYSINIPDADQQAKAFQYSDASELANELDDLIYTCTENHLPQQLIEPLYKLRSTVNSFGFCFTGIDLREDAGYVRSAALSILGSEDTSLAEDVTEERLYDAIKAALISGKTKSPDIESIQKLIAQQPQQFTEKGTLEHRINAMVRVMKLAQTEISMNASSHLLLSMTHSSVDILSALFILNTHQLVQYDKQSNTLSGTVDIVPLFETIEDLNNAPHILENLFQDPVYRDYLQSRDNVQKVLMAYSDSNKDGGYISSRWHLQQAQIAIMTLAKKYGLRVQFYHGRGGSIGRGGGPTRQNMLSLPAHSIDEGLQITEQGEVLARYYLSKNSTLNHFSNLIMASVDKHLAADHDANITTQWHSLMDKLSTKSEAHYRALKSMPGFIEYFNGATPREIEQIYIGSRPSHRKKASTINDLRAIPWVFRWSQSRTFIPGWYGVGTALSSLLSNDDELNTLRQMYNSWPFFTGLIDNCAEALCQTDIHIVAHYKTLLALKNEESDTEQSEYDRIFTAIKKEYEQTLVAIKKVTHQETLLATGELQKTRNSIEVKRAYLDPLNYLQVYLLGQFRACIQEGTLDTETSEDILSLYQRAFISSTGGIVAGLGVSG